ncbi:MAG: virulence factor MviN, partial [Arcanobacterium sp.]|nr:virulence factor MviN [Arcanobacterium sp.]
LLTMFAWQVPLYGISVVCAGVLQAHDRFVLPALAPLLSSIVVIGVFLAYAELYPPHADPSELSRFAIYLLGWGTTAGVMVFSLPQFIPVMRLVPIKPTFHFPPGVARHTMHLAGAGLGALLAQQIAIVVIMYATNELGGVGTYNVFNYSFAVFMVPYAVLAVPIATVTFPQISKAVSAGDTDRAARVTARSTRLVLFMGILAAALLAVEAKPAQVVLEVGRNIAHLDYAMTAMAIGLIGYSLLYHGARVLYALDAGRYVIAVNSLGWGVVVITLLIGLAVASPGRFGALTWVGMALSVGMSVGGVAVLCAIRAKLGAGSLHGIVRTAVVGVASCAVLTWVGRYVVNLFFAPHGSASVATALLAAVLGALICVGGAACVALLFDRSLVSGIRS